LKNENDLLSVSEITKKIRSLLEGGLSSVRVQGELSNVKRHTSGHLYFTLKDDFAQIAGVMWRSRVGGLTFTPQDGMKVVVSGRVTVYEVRGNYQLDAVSITPLGAGELQLAFERLKRTLAAEGLFDARWKKPLPPYPERIGIVTSPTGAALHDILSILGRRFPGVFVVLAPARVQGAGAAGEIAQAIRDLNAYGEIDVMIVGRGGGSLEDLWAFNEELVARAIFESEIPVVSAVGHEIDFTIADFVADLRAPTPSAAAELVVKDRTAIAGALRQWVESMQGQIRQLIATERDTIRHHLKSYAFNRPIDLVRQYSQRTDELTRSVSLCGEHTVEVLHQRVAGLEARMASLDPALALKRGYAIVSMRGKTVSSRALLTRDDLIDIRFQDGTVQSKIT
jgi:exodeoxyribonuclease VII large subunit